MADVEWCSRPIVSGSIVGCAADIEDAFDLIVFLCLDAAVRVRRLRDREMRALGHADPASLAWAGRSKTRAPRGPQLGKTPRLAGGQAVPHAGASPRPGRSRSRGCGLADGGWLLRQRQTHRRFADRGSNRSTPTAMAFIGFIAWALALLRTEVMRSVPVCTCRVPANQFRPDNANLSPVMQRLARARQLHRRPCPSSRDRWAWRR